MKFIITIPKARLTAALCLTLIAMSCHPHGPDADDKPKAAGAPATTQAEPEGPKAKIDPVAIEKFHITVKKVFAHAFTPTFTTPARVAFNSEGMANVGPQVAGRVMDVKAKLGDSIKKGDDLLVILSNDLGEAQSDFLLKRTTVDAATSAVQPAKTAYDRAKTLFDKSEGIALAEVQKREAEWRAAGSALKSAEESLAASVRKLHLLGMEDAGIEKLTKTGSVEPRYTVHAPIAGQVIERNVTLGQLVSPDKEPLFVLADLGTLWVIADVPEGRLKDVARGADVRVAAGGQEVAGTVAYVAAAIDPTTRTVQVRVAIKGDQAGWKPGLFAEAEFDLPQPADAEPVIALPQDAVQTVNGVPVVFVPDEDEPNTFGIKPVITGTPAKGKVPILFGLNSKDKVVTSGAFILKAQLAKPAAD